MTLVSLGACMFVSLSTMLDGDSSPTRIAAQVVSGVGFLSGGVILRDGFTVTGLNTAATLWCSAAVGSLIGAGYFLEGLTCSILIIMVNILIRLLSYKLDTLASNCTQVEEDETPIILSVIGGSTSEMILRTEIINLLDKYYLKFGRFSCVDLAGKKIRFMIEIDPSSNLQASVKEIVIMLSQMPEVIEVEQLYI